MKAIIRAGEMKPHATQINKSQHNVIHPSDRTAPADEVPVRLRRDIDAGNQAWIDGLKAGYAGPIAATYLHDGINCTATGECLKGRDAIAAHYQGIIREFGRASNGLVCSQTLHVDHDLAYETGYAEAHFLNRAVRKGRFSTVWKLDSDGHWRIFRNMSLPASTYESREMLCLP